MKAAIPERCANGARGRRADGLRVSVIEQIVHGQRGACP